mmetsp:Transcript_135322/g.234628  ORF Transcript_135322/g.234628 Transcript_135322/m.234628 type:complete len:91 (-) Transcript_135322:806-1078(-)
MLRHISSPVLSVAHAGQYLLRFATLLNAFSHGISICVQGLLGPVAQSVGLWWVLNWSLMSISSGDLPTGACVACLPSGSRIFAAKRSTAR